MPIKFRTAYDPVESVAQSFDREKMNYIQGGQEYNRFDRIQEANKDLNIYEVLKKYNLSDDLCTAEEYYKNLNGPKGTIADITMLQEFAHKGEMLQYIQKTHDMFMRLPLELRQKFDNNAEKFMKEGEAFLQHIINEKTKPQEPIKEDQQDVTK